MTVPPLSLDVPVNMRVAKRGIGGRVNGAFEESRVLYPLPIVVSPAQDLVVSVAPDSPQAQPIQIAGQAIVATAIDLLLAVTKNGSLLIDLRDDLGGKPDTASLLPKPVQFQIAGPIGVPPEGGDAAKASWVSVQLPAAFQFQMGRKYWLALQSVEGEANWSLEATKGTDIALQRTPDGGLSWQLSTASAFRGPVAALFRLRGKPDAFTMPIEIEIGSEDPARGLKPERVTLNRFAPLGRVDFTLDFDEVADGFNRFLDNAAPTLCPEGEHLVNGDFEKWLQVGDELVGTPTSIDLGNTPLALVVSPDSSRAYVLSSPDEGSGLIQVVDIECRKIISEEEITLASSPTALVLSPDGTRAYVGGDDELQIIDLGTRGTLGKPFSSFPGVTQSMAISPDGGILYATTSAPGEILAIDTSELADVVTGAKPESDLKIISMETTFSEVKLLDSVPDGSGIYATGTTKDTLPALELLIFDTATFKPAGNVVTTLPPDTVALCISPEGTRAFVASESTITVIDLHGRPAIGMPISLGTAQPTAIAISPDGGALLVGDGAGNTLLYFQIGSRQPDEWNLVSGQVMPYCLPEPYHLIAVLGELPVSKTKDNEIPSILSQVVPVAESCPYEIRFLGIANSEGATVEVRWLDQKGALIGSKPGQVSIAPKEDGKREVSSLSLHYQQLTAPKDATQAEIRFVVPGGIAAAIDNVSFHATTEAVVNSDFSLREDDRLAGWSLSPGAASGVSLLAIESGVRLQNAGTETVELVQTIPANRSQLFELQVENQVLRSKTGGNPRVEVHWLKDGVPLADDVVLDIPMESFSGLRANGTSPEPATQAEIHLIVPPGATQELRRASMTFTPTVTVPLAFIAQTSGELTVSALRVAFEKAVTLPPPIPDTGLFMPAPAQANGETGPGEDGCFCACCKSTEPMTNATTMTTEAGRPVQVGGCATCGDQLVRFGGPVIPNAPRFTLRNELAAKPVVLMRSLATLAGSQLEEIHAVAPPQPLTAINHIGEAREKRLRAAGIDSVAKLAATPAKKLMELLKPGVSEEMARNIVQDAARLAKGQ